MGHSEGEPAVPGSGRFTTSTGRPGSRPGALLLLGARYPARHAATGSWRGMLPGRGYTLSAALDPRATAGPQAAMGISILRGFCHTLEIFPSASSHRPGTTAFIVVGAGAWAA